jgi:hypothetical protein
VVGAIEAAACFGYWGHAIVLAILDFAVFTFVRPPEAAATGGLTPVRPRLRRQLLALFGALLLALPIGWKRGRHGNIMGVRTEQRRIRLSWPAQHA